MPAIRRAVKLTHEGALLVLNAAVEAAGTMGIPNASPSSTKAAISWLSSGWTVPASSPSKAPPARP